MIVNRRCTQKYLRCFVVALLLVGLTTVCPAVAAAVDIYYFSPDSPQRNLGGLKREMETFFDHVQFTATFQPFAHFVDFDQTVRKKLPSFLLLPAWYYQLNGEKLGLRPLLSPLAGGATTYHKILLVRKASPITMATIRNQSLAMTTMGPADESTLNTILFAPHGVDSHDLNIVTVPKDTDALFALALGHVDMALVGKRSIEQIGELNPKIMQAVQPLAESAPIPGPILCYAKGRVARAIVEQLKGLLQKKPNGTNVLEILQIDGWRVVGE
ncbi:phosphate/phosphite/phosphonate ABC transporter substrate-binding protein [Thermodesulfobacteriota bacterium]